MLRGQRGSFYDICRHHNKPRLLDYEQRRQSNQVMIIKGLNAEQHYRAALRLKRHFHYLSFSLFLISGSSLTLPQHIWSNCLFVTWWAQGESGASNEINEASWVLETLRAHYIGGLPRLERFALQSNSEVPLENKQSCHCNIRSRVPQSTRSSRKFTAGTFSSAQQRWEGLRYNVNKEISVELSSLFFTLPVEVCTWMQLQKDCANKLNILMPTCCEEKHLNWEKMQWRDWESNINILPENPNTSERERYNDGWQALGDLFLKEVQVQPRFDVQDDSPP